MESKDGPKVMELEEGEIEEDGDAVNKFVRPVKAREVTSSDRTNSLSSCNPAGNIPRHNHVIANKHSHRGRILVDRLPQATTLPDGSFWGPVDLFEKHKNFEKRFAWFNSPRSRVTEVKCSKPSPRSRDTENKCSKPNPRSVPKASTAHSPKSKSTIHRSMISKEQINNSSFEELLEQYKTIQLELKNYKEHCGSNKGMKTINSNSTKNENNTGTTTRIPNTKPKRVRRSRRAGKDRRKIVQIQSEQSATLNKCKDVDRKVLEENKNVPNKIKCEEDDEDEFELRRIALASAIKPKITEVTETEARSQEILPDDLGSADEEYFHLRDTKENINRCLKQVPIVENIQPVEKIENSGDNYEMVEMDLDSDQGDISMETIILMDPGATNLNSLPNNKEADSIESDKSLKLTVQSESQAAVIPENSSLDDKDHCDTTNIVDEDEEILRAQLLMSLAKQSQKKPKVDTTELANDDQQGDDVIPIDDKSVANLTVTIDVENSETTRDVQVQNERLSATASPTLPNSRVIINLAEDSSDSENESMQQTTECGSGVLASISAFIKQARKQSSTSKLEKTPQAVYQLSHSQQLEYHRLKAEIAKREGIKPSLLTFSPVTSASQSPKREDVSSEVKEKMMMRQKLGETEEVLQRNKKEMMEEQHRLKLMRSQLNKFKLDFGNAKIKVSSLKHQLLNAEKASTAIKLKVHKMSNQVSTVQASINKKFAHIRSLDAKCLKLRREISGNKYSSPASALALRKRNSSVKSNSKMKKPKLSMNGENKKSNKTLQGITDKEKLKNLEKEIAARLVLLQSKMNSAQKEVKENNANMSKDIEKSVSTKRPRRRSLLDMDPSTKPKLVGDLKIDDSPSLLAVSAESNHDDLIKNLSIKKQNILRKLAQQTFSILPLVPKAHRHPTKVLDMPFMLKGKRKQKSSSKRHFSPYVSPLVLCKSYCFSPYFKQSIKYYSSDTVCNATDPHKRICRFDLTGICNDDQCPWQHESDYKLTVSETLIEISSYMPSVAGLAVNYEKSTNNNNFLDTFNKCMIGVTDFNKDAKDDYCAILIDCLNRKRKKAKGEHVILEERNWKPEFNKRKSGKRQDINEDTQTNSLKYETRNLDPGILTDELDSRYFTSDDQSLDNMEAAVLDDANNIELWIKLFQHHLLNKAAGDNNLERALNALSRGLEYNQSSFLLWSHYLNLYSCWPNNDLQLLCEKATQFCLHYVIWSKYLDTVKEFSKKQSICDEILKFIQNDDCDMTVVSHRLVEIVLYKCQLSLVAGHHQRAFLILQESLGMRNKSECLSADMTVGDCCFLWLCFIHLVEFNSLPPNIFDSNNDNMMKIVRKECYLNWHRHKKLQTPFDRLLSYFQAAMKQCDAEPKECSNKTPESFPLYVSLINLELYHQRKEDAMKVCRKLLKTSMECEEIWCCLLSIIAGVPQVMGPSAYSFKAHSFVPPSQTLSRKCSTDEDVTFENDRKILIDELLNTYNEASDDVPESSALTHLVVCYIHDDVNTCQKLLLESIARLCKEQVMDVKHGLNLYKKHLNNAGSIDRTVNESKESSDCSYNLAYHWLNYCYLLELTGMDSDDVVEAYETAIQSNQSSIDMKKIWYQYIQYILRTTSSAELSQGDHFLSIIKRCLMAVPVNYELPFNTNQLYSDFTFHNEMMDVLLSLMDDNQAKVNAHHDLVSFYPTNVVMVNRSFRYFLSVKDWPSAKYICDFYSKKCLPSVSFWKMAVSLSYNDDDPEMVRKVLKTATSILPYSSTLWKDIILFELSLGASTNITEVLKSCSKLEINVEKFLQFLLEEH